MLWKRNKGKTLSNDLASSEPHARLSKGSSEVVSCNALSFPCSEGKPQKLAPTLSESEAFPGWLISTKHGKSDRKTQNWEPGTQQVFNKTGVESACSRSPRNGRPALNAPGHMPCKGVTLLVLNAFILHCTAPWFLVVSCGRKMVSFKACLPSQWDAAKSASFDEAVQ